MARLRRFRPSGSMLVAILALVMATTGSAVAASLITSKQIKDGTIQTKDISKKAKKALKGQRGPRGLTGLAGSAGAQGPKGDPGAKGDTGAAGPLLDTLPSGKTLRGSFNGGNGADAAGRLVEASISYDFPLASNVNAQVVQIGGASTPECPGSVTNPQAAQGNLCIYVEDANATGAVSSYGTADGDVDYRWGAALYAFATGAANVSEFWGTYAVTAP